MGSGYSMHLDSGLLVVLCYVFTLTSTAAILPHRNRFTGRLKWQDKMNGHENTGLHKRGIYLLRYTLIGKRYDDLFNQSHTTFVY